MHIRKYVANDAEAIWAVLEPIVRAGETYTLPREMTRENALSFWLSPGHEVLLLKTLANSSERIFSAPIGRAAGRTWLTVATSLPLHKR